VRLALLLALCALASPALAELYRWVDPQSGSIKYSNHPPPWHGDATRAASAPKVEVIPSQVAAPSKLAAAPESKSELLAGLESRWRDLLEDLGTFNSRADFERAGAGLRQHVETYDAVRAELDRIDPAGAARRRKEEGGALDKVKKGLEAWLRR
jgi:hypothetical protein